jgi:hypothetical protein
MEWSDKIKLLGSPRKERSGGLALKAALGVATSFQPNTLAKTSLIAMPLHFILQDVFRHQPYPQFGISNQH